MSLTERQMHRIKRALALVIDRTNKIRGLKTRKESTTHHTVKDINTIIEVHPDIKVKYDEAITEEMELLNTDILNLQQEANGNEVIDFPKPVT